jgi:hypothetical protein
MLQAALRLYAFSSACLKLNTKVSKENHMMKNGKKTRCGDCMPLFGLS